MGDRRFDPQYERVTGADRVQVISTMTDDDIISALAAASRAQDPYLANVLATAAHNRMRRARAVSEQISEGLCTLDVYGCVPHINNRGCELLGALAPEVAGKDFHAIVHPYHAAGRGSGDDCELNVALQTATAARIETTFASPHGAFATDVSATAVLVDDVIDARVILFQDVSQRKAHEELLDRQRAVLRSAVEKSLGEVERRREAEDRFRQLFEASPDPSFVTDEDGRIVLMNARALTATGYGEDIVGLAADLLLDASPDGSTPRWMDLAGSSGVVVKRKDGSTYRADVATSSFVASNRKMRLVTLRDVTLRWMADARLREQERMLREAERVAQMGSWVWLPATDRLLWSEQMYALFGHEPGAVDLGLEAFLAHVHPDDRERVAAVITRARETGEPYEFEVRILRPDGSMRTLRALGSCETGPRGAVVRMVGTLQDVTLQREAEAALLRSESRFNRVVETVPYGILILQDDGSVSYANPAARVGQAALSGDATWLNTWNGRIRKTDGTPIADLRAELQRTIRDGVAKDLELLVDDPSGGTRMLMVNAVMMRESENRPAAALVTFHDATPLHDARRRAAELDAELEARTARQTALLRTSNAELQAFAYTVSHDLQAPLRSIEYLVEELSGRSAPITESLPRIQKEVRRMRDLVRDLLELSKLNATEIERRPVDLGALARDVLAELSAREPARSVAFHVEDGLLADADARLVRVLLENLLGNAWKYTAKVASPEIQVGRSTAGVYFVRDNGAGFDSTAAVGLFQPFKRFHSSTDYEGTGVGLATAHRIVQKHGGQIWAESTPGIGATFYFTIDAATPTEGASP